MTQTGTALGSKINVVGAASGVHIPLKNAEAVTFVQHVANGVTDLALKESKAGADEQDLAAITLVHRAPGIGGTWTAVEQTAAATYVETDATNNAVVVTVRARQLSDGFDSVELTAATGTVTAILHDLNIEADPTVLASTVV